MPLPTGRPPSGKVTRIPWFAAVVLLACSALIGHATDAASRKIDDYHWENVDRIVAIGDLHGDHANFVLILQAAGVVNARGQWTGGATHLVQLGDVPDRGSDTRKIIEHLRKLGLQARRRGGAVHTLLGNHEAMNTYGDLRYVSAGEFAAFAGRDSLQLRDRYFETVLADIKLREPLRFATLPDDFRAAWDAAHPLGWVEHQNAWNPKWNPRGEYFLWAMQDKVAVRINDHLFVHGGISASYCQNSLASLTEKARDALRLADPARASVLTDENGPLWYRGLAGVAPKASAETVDAVLQNHNARHIVIAHTPTAGAIWPSYSGRVIQVDTGLSSHYGSHVAWLEITPAGMFAGYRSGKLALPTDDEKRIDYLRQVVALQPDNSALKKQLALMQTSARSAGEGAGESLAVTNEMNDARAATVNAGMPTCGISP